MQGEIASVVAAFAMAVVTLLTTAMLITPNAIRAPVAGATPTVLPCTRTHLRGSGRPIFFIPAIIEAVLSSRSQSGE
jgi:hypothetical protein